MKNTIKFDQWVEKEITKFTNFFQFLEEKKDETTGDIIMTYVDPECHCNYYVIHISPIQRLVRITNTSTGKTSVAYCSKQDKFDIEIGIATALSKYYK